MPSDPVSHDSVSEAQNQDPETEQPSFIFCGKKGVMRDKTGRARFTPPPQNYQHFINCCHLWIMRNIKKNKDTRWHHSEIWSHVPTWLLTNFKNQMCGIKLFWQNITTVESDLVSGRSVLHTWLVLGLWGSWISSVWLYDKWCSGGVRRVGGLNIVAFHSGGSPAGVLREAHAQHMKRRMALIFI